MTYRLIFIAFTMLFAAPAFAAGSHSGGHGNSGGHHAEMAIGKPGNASEVDRTIEVVMKETDDGGMIFEPNEIAVDAGETIRFAIRNEGELEHEFVLDDHAGIHKHKAMMEKMPEMEHDDPNSLRLDPGHEGEIFWKFSNSGAFEFACLIPGHYDSGMKGILSVIEKSASN